MQEEPRNFLLHLYRQAFSTRSSLCSVLLSSISNLFYHIKFFMVSGLRASKPACANLRSVHMVITDLREIDNASLLLMGLSPEYNFYDIPSFLISWDPPNIKVIRVLVLERVGWTFGRINTNSSQSGNETQTEHDRTALFFRALRLLQLEHVISLSALWAH